MGGIPYQSRGCTTCRQRKIKCDLAKPECARCVRRGTRCLGYETSRHFLHHTLVTRVDASGTSRRPVAQMLGQLNPLALPAPLNLETVVRTQLFSTFMNTFFASNSSHNVLSAKDDSWYFLMARFPSLAGESALLDRSIMALVCAFLGREANDLPLMNYGGELYSDALRVMAWILRQRLPPTPHVLYTTIVFHTYETMQTGEASLQNCLTHVRGATAILNHPSFRDRPVQDLTGTMITRQKLAAVRAFCITTCPSKATDGDWECLTRDRATRPLDAILALLAESVQLQQRLDVISCQPRSECKEAATQMLLQHCLDLAERLRTCLPNGLSESRSSETRLFVPWDPSVLRPAPQPLPFPEDDLAHPPLYEFANLATAKSVLLFWIVALTIRRLLSHTKTLCQEGTQSTLGAVSSTLLCISARELRRTVAHLLQPRNLMSSAHCILFAVSVVSKCYLDGRDEVGFAWCQDIYRLLQSRGWGMAGRLGDADRRLWACIQVPTAEDMEFSSPPLTVDVSHRIYNSWDLN
ncbi:Zn(II)2Cys6 transcription factor domain-containing protein [Aspergillus brunneoviolaceus CBS 621.78]|uniref:Uncharacterized protein n=1 Tax=Aspergillus brunneoviolaceus CBS 621.78 TaxID=1450534 RepID=A0ACD1FU14_9EURO|nr:hypothetical protein BO95DRAFT_424652 [Aspergillus brunneoviolaceus CBS 621.78]RAH40497.1 hypothetical protein BO95DRAFT_424652 [Aspergillus brunneoviolaceus CBS 621.78]